MYTIKKLLERFKNITPPDAEVKKHLRRIIFEETKLQIKKEEICFNAGITYLNISPTQKTEIFLHKEKILKKLHKEPGCDKVLNIL